MASMLISIESSELDIATLRHQFDKSHNRRRMTGEIIAYLKAMMGGFKPGYMTVTLASAHASGTYTCTNSSAVNSTDVATIAGTALAMVASPSTESQWAKGATDATMATALAACINAHSTLSKIVRAKASSNVVTVTAIASGPIGNLVTTTETGNGMAVSGAALANGASDESDALQLGYDPRV